MTRDAILSKIRDILSEVVDDDALAISESTVADDVPDWDSVNHVKLLIGLESDLKIRFDTDDLDKLPNVGTLIDVVQDKLAKSG